MAHLHNITDDELNFLINAKTRRITSQSDTSIKLIQGDHNSERFTFEVPRYIEGHDMSECSKVEVHYLNVSRDKQNKSADVYRVDDLKVSPDSDDVITFSWLISGNATKYAGILSFCVRFTCLTGEKVEYAWHTEIYSEIGIGDGMNNGEAVLTEYSDVIAAWEKTIIEKLDFGEVIAQAEANAKKYTDERVTDLKERVEILEGGVLEYETVTGLGSVPVPRNIAGKKAFINAINGRYESNNKNLFNPALFGLEVNSAGLIHYPGGNAFKYATIHLPAGAYTISSQLPLFINIPDADAAGPGEDLTFFVPNDGDVGIEVVGDYSSVTEEEQWFSVMLNKGENAQPFVPYTEGASGDVVKVSAIVSSQGDTYNIPEAIQNLDGYGAGVDGYWNTVDFDKKAFFKRYDADQPLDGEVELSLAHILEDYDEVLAIDVEPGGLLRLVSNVDGGGELTVTFVFYKA